MNFLVDAGNMVIMVEHDMHVIASSDWIINLGSGAVKKVAKLWQQAPPTGS
ncbi:MAG: hypothetical protein JSS82_14095 [Bacteroidetes bacterium]|nr:hypothetical protein [Bacteroidota bacterium]